MTSALRQVGEAERRAVAQAHPEQPDFDPDFFPFMDAVAPFTMVTLERCYALWQAIEYLSRRGIEGAVVECGVWRGGSSMLAALGLLRQRDTGRDLYLYDTYEGMPPPTEDDYEQRTGKFAADDEDLQARRAGTHIVGDATLDEVRANLRSTGYPPEQLHFVKGMIETTIPADAPERIALLRLDVDWHEATRHALVELWHRVPTGGILLLNDYGYWAGARKAVDEFLGALPNPPLLDRIDRGGRIAVKR